MSDWNAYGDRAYFKRSDVRLVWDVGSGTGVNVTASVFGGADWTSGTGEVVAVAALSGGYAFAGYVPTGTGGAAGIWRVDNTANNLHTFIYGGAYVGGIGTNGTSTSYNTTSDYRLKKNARPINNPVATLKKLKPITFEWTANDKTTDGFLAHEFGKVIPGACTGKKDAVDKVGNIIPQGIDQSKAVPLLVAALQEAVARIEALEAQLAA